MKIDWKGTVNRLPEPTFRWLGVNDSTMELTGEICPGAGLRREGSPEGIMILSEGEAGWAELAGNENIRKAWEMASGMGEAAAGLMNEKRAGRTLIYAAEGSRTREPVRLAARRGESGLEEQLIYAEKDSELTVLMEYESPREASGTLGIRTLIRAESGARVHLVKVQMLGKGFRHFDDIGGSCGEGAGIRLTCLELGGSQVWNGCRISLSGAKSGFEARAGYLGREDQKLDMNYHVIHQGKKTASRMEIQGVLDGKAEKIFRGTIDLKKGSSGAEGEEREDVFLLSKEAVNKTVPLILCTEEEVAGNHGATIGRLGDDVLFYMESRGIGKEEAKRLMTASKLARAAGEVPSEKTKERIRAYLEEVL